MKNYLNVQSHVSTKHFGENFDVHTYKLRNGDVINSHIVDNPQGFAF